MFYNARWYDSQLGRFAQADSIVPGGVQGYDRYAYVNNNPVNGTDPSGHWPWPSGNQIQLNIALGFTLQLSNLGHGDADKTILLFYSLSLVTDDKGGIQLYGTKRDQEYRDGTSPSGSGFTDGPAETSNPSTAITAGISVAYGAIDGTDFRTKGTLAYEGYAVDDTIGLGPFTGDEYVYADPVTGIVDPSRMTGYNIGLSAGIPASTSHVATKSIPITDRYQLPEVGIAWCKVAGMCGSYPGAGPDPNPISQNFSNSR